RDKADSEFLKGRYDFLLRSPRPQRVFALQSSDRLDCVCATDGLHSCFGKAEVLDLAFLNQVLHRSSDVFDRHVRVDPMLIEQVDDINLESLERALGGLLDVLWPAVQTRRSRPIIAAAQVESEFGGDHHSVTEGSESFAHQLFVQERAVDLGSVEECDAAFHSCPEKRGHLLLVFGRTVRKANSHAAEPEGRDFQAAISKFALLHCFSLGTVCLVSRLESIGLGAVSRSFRFLAYFSCTVDPRAASAVILGVKESETVDHEEPQRRGVSVSRSSTPIAG